MAKDTVTCPSFSRVLLDWQWGIWVLTDLWHPLRINVRYRAVLYFGLLLTSCSIYLRQRCWVCPFFLFVWNVIPTGQWGKKCCMSYAVALLPSFCCEDAASSADKSSCSVVLECGPCGLECRRSGLDLNITLLNFTAENSVLGTVSREWCSSLLVQAILLPLVLMLRLMLSHTYICVHIVFIRLNFFFVTNHYNFSKQLAHFLSTLGH